MTMATTRIEAARAYLDRGWQPIPIPGGQKKPVLDDWVNLRMAPDALGMYFGEPGNIGILLGEPSGGLVDVDLDGPEAVALAPIFLPTTAACFGRGSKPDSHWLYIASPAIDTVKFSPDPAVERNNMVLFVGRVLPHKGVNYLLDYSALTNQLRWHVTYGGNTSMGRLTVLVDASTGEFIHKE